MPDRPFPPPPAINTEIFRLAVFMSLNMQRKETGGFYFTKYLHASDTESL